MSTVTGYRIAEVARRSGFSRPTLRYYEDMGLMPRPERTDAGYRVYDDQAVERLAFIARAKRLGCSLDEIGGLLEARQADRCGPVQHRLRALVAAKLSDTRARLAELGQLTDSLEASAAALAGRPVDGPCDDDCACNRVPTTDGETTDGATTDVVTTEGEVAGSLEASNAGDDPPIACSLGAHDLEARLAEWREVLAHVRSRSPLDGGARLELGPDAPVAEVARLAQAEQGCCRFFSFALTVDARGVGLEVTAPPGAEPMLTAVLGAAT